MRKEIKLVIVLISLVSTIHSKAQSTATAVVTVTIVESVTVSSNQSKEFEKVEAPSVFDILFRSGNIYLPKEFIRTSSYSNTITAADFVINAADVYALTIPQKILLMNVSGTERMDADILPGNASPDEALCSGKKHLVINAGLRIKNGQARGKYASEAFDVTVNFN